MADADSGLLGFRTVWLNAIAKAWTDPIFEQRLLKQEPTEDLLQETFSYHWPWKGDLTLRIIRGDEFVWSGDDWAWPSVRDDEESFTIFAPLAPPSKHTPESQKPEDQATALADYYRIRPSLLTSSLLKSEPLASWNFAVSPALAGHLLNRTSPAAQVTSSASQHGSPGPIGGFIPNATDFANFEVALLYAISKAWGDESFRVYLQNSPQLAIASCHGYHAPWVLPIRIRDDENATWHPRAKEWRGKWLNLSANKLTLCLPTKPLEVKDFGVALAAYNAIGAQYPFTCCP